MQLPKEVVTIIGEFVGLSGAVNMASTCKEAHHNMNTRNNVKKLKLEKAFLDLVADHYYYIHNLPFDKIVHVYINGEIEIVISSNNGISFPNLSDDTVFDTDLLYSIIQLHSRDDTKVCNIMMNVYHSDPEMVHMTDITSATTTVTNMKAATLCRVIEECL